ncbi:hypothetical protein Q604_UNBc4C00125G0001, partial [human gut metagenome]
MYTWFCDKGHETKTQQKDYVEVK